MNQFVMIDPTQLTEMPDVATSDSASYATTLDWVGMGQISLPLHLECIHPANNMKSNFQVNSRVDCFVNLNNQSVKGIHMSRLYLLLTEFAEQNQLTPEKLHHFIGHLLDSHKDISDQARLVFDFDIMLKRPALKSSYSGWKSYPCGIEARLENGQVSLIAHTSVAYSSTCPCSAALARQLVQAAFSENFSEQETLSKATVEQWLRSEQASFATPHSQRSEAYIEYKLEHDSSSFRFIEIINAVEAALGTPVQTAVKREDEQEFARLNGHNLMFCEDAARKIKHKLNLTDITDFRAKVSHYESLHAHDAVSMTSKGIPDGMKW